MPLTDVKCRNAKGKINPYKLSDGGGLHLLVNADGAKYWRLAYRWHGKQRTLALGVYPAVGLWRRVQRATMPSAIWPPTSILPRLNVSVNGLLRLPLAIPSKPSRVNGMKTGRRSDALLRWPNPPTLEANVFPAIGRRPIAELEPRTARYAAQG